MENQYAGADAFAYIWFTTMIARTSYGSGAEIGIYGKEHTVE